MRVVEICLYQHDLPVRGGRYQMSTSEVAALDTTVVQLVTDDGLSGFGETCPLGPAYQPQFATGERAAIAEMAPHLLGLDPRHIGLINHRMDAALAGQNSAKAAIDVACWDLLGKATGMPVHELLGGAHTDRVASYWGIMPATPEASAAKAAELVADGYRRLQLKTGGRPVADDVAAMHAIAEVVDPSVRLLADANRGWTVRDALEFSIACRHIPLVLEQPCATLEEHRQLVAKTAHPVFLDESSQSVAAVITAITDGLAQGFGMKLSRVGGLSKLRAVRDICEATNTPLTIDDTWGGDIATAATVHMGATVRPDLYEGTWISAPYTEYGYPTQTPQVVCEAGHIAVPRGPGLGIEPDLTAWPNPVATFR